MNTTGIFIFNSSFTSPSTNVMRFANNRTGGRLDFVANGQPKMALFNSGDLLIGWGPLGIPTARLDVVGQVRIRGGSPGSGKVLTSDADGVGSWQNAGADGDWTISGGDIHTSLSGNVGIGDSTPDAKLDVSGIALFSSNVGIGMASGSPSDRLDVLGSAHVSSRAAVGAAVSSKARLRVADCDWGGTPQPFFANTLVVEDDVSPTLAFRSDGSFLQGIWFSDSDDQHVGRIDYQHNGDKMFFTTGGFPGLKLDGRLLGIGLGNGDPTANLTIRGDGTTPLLRVERDFAQPVPLMDSDGKLGVGTTSIGARLHVNGDTSDNVFRVQLDNATKLVVDENVRVGVSRLNPTTNALEVGGNASKSTAGSWLANSDRRLKQDIRVLEHGIETIKRLRPVRFRYNELFKSREPSVEDRDYYNFIAQEYQQIFPDSVQDDGTEYLQVDTYNVRPYLVKAVQELSDMLEAQQKAAEQLAELVETQQQQIDELKALVRQLAGDRAGAAAATEQE